MTASEQKALEEATAKVKGSVWSAAHRLSGNAAQKTGRFDEYESAWFAVADSARAAALALSVRDLIGEHGFTQEHYDTLTKPWRVVIGVPHPDDTVPQ